MDEGNVIQFPVKRLGVDVPEPLQASAVEVQPDGHVKISAELSNNEAARIFWSAVEGYVLEAWEKTALSREKKRVRLLTTYLNHVDPEWRTKIREILNG